MRKVSSPHQLYIGSYLSIRNRVLFDTMYINFLIAIHQVIALYTVVFIFCLARLVVVGVISPKILWRIKVPLECIVNWYAVKICITEEIVPAFISASDIRRTSIREICVHPSAARYIKHGPKDGRYRRSPSQRRNSLWS